MATSQASKTVVAQGFAVKGVYAGGPYVNLQFVGDKTPFDVINVWDLTTGALRQGLTADGDAYASVLKLGMEDWLVDLYDDEIQTYRDNTRVGA
jgi:hypothetical protein